MESIDNERGNEKVATFPAPSTLVNAPVPAIVLTYPLGVILRIRLLVESDTNKLLLESITIPKGRLKVAVVVALSTNGDELPKTPANALTPPFGVILNICCAISKSVTYTLPFVSMAIPAS